MYQMEHFRNQVCKLTGIWLSQYIDGLVQDCGISTANALEIPQCCTKQSICDLQTRVSNGFDITNRFIRCSKNLTHLIKFAEIP